MSAFAFPFASPFGSGFSFAIGEGGSSLEDLDITAPGALSSQIDQVIDPATWDYVRTENGEWAETADTRTMMLLMLSIELGASPYDPADGTTIAELRRDGAPLTPEVLKDETMRAGGILQAAGIISDLAATVRDPQGRVLKDAAGRTVVAVTWRDLSSGSPVDLAFQPG